jgi:anthranilate synthase component 2
MKILVLDNYDSFTYNLVYLIRQLGYGQQLDIRRNDAFTLDEVEQFDKILLSPGPGIPQEAGLMPAVLQRFGTTKAILGICLGHQAIAEVVPDRLFAGLPSQFAVGRYHSWVVDEAHLPAEFEVIGRTTDQQIMAIRHKQYDLRGLQFHPESILTEHGSQLIKNWLQF